ncbi:MAG: cyclase family protein [Acidimicrobiales bacterium]
MPLPDHLELIRKRVSNWGRWGDDDQLGTGNLLSPAAAIRGVAAVRTGRRFSLAVNLDTNGPQVGQPPRRINALLSMVSINERDRHAPGMWAGSDDLVTMSTCAGTHVDALSHVTYDGLMYNGFPAANVTASAGATTCGAETLLPIVSRAVLLDVAAVKGVAGLDEVDPAYAITAADLDSAAAVAGVTMEPGDVALVRTGEMRHFRAGNRRRYTLGDEYRFPGLSIQTVEWFADHDVAAAFTDTYAYEVFPPSAPDWSDTLGVHMLHLRDMGLVQGQNWDLEELAADCAADGQFDMLLLAAPEPITGATSAPVHPVAVK